MHNLLHSLHVSSSVLSAVNNQGSEIALNGNNVISILIFGLLYLLFAYVSVFSFYIASIKKIKDNQESLYGTMAKAFFIQIAALIGIWTLITTIDIFAQYSSSASIDAGTACLLFFKVNWLQVNIVSIINSLQNSGSPVAVAGLLIIVVAIWVIMTIIFIAVPLFLIGTLVFMGYSKAQQQISNSSQIDIVTNIISTLIFMMVVFSIHFLFPTVFLNGMAQENSAQVAKYTKGLPVFKNYGYRDKIKSFIDTSIHIQ